MSDTPPRRGRGRPALPDRLPGTQLPEGSLQALRDVLRASEGLGAFQRDVVMREIARRQQQPDGQGQITQALAEATAAQLALDSIQPDTPLDLSQSGSIPITPRVQTLILELLAALAAGADPFVERQPFYISQAQAAQLLGLKQADLTQMEKAGKIPAFGNPRNRQYRLSDILPLKPPTP